ncbi:MAG: 2-hydroxyacid dehydrogenase [Candidatus Thorarchaeota archaeon]
MQAKVFVTRMIPDKGLDLIEDECDVIVWDKEMPPTEQEIIKSAQNCEGIVTLLSDPISANVIDNLPRLRVIAQYAVGYDNIDIEAATRRGILVTNTPGVLTETTADLAWALLMAASRRIVEADKYVRNGQWKIAWGPQLLLGRDIYNATIGIVGMGRIGLAVARRAHGFDMKILYTSRSETATTRKAEDELGALRVDLDTLLEQADFVSLHVPLTKNTRQLINRERLKRMKPTAVLINTARGPVVDEDGLVEALQRGWIRAAGLDVFRNEPLPQDSPLLSLQNVILAPHIGSASVETRSKMSLICAENLLAGLKGMKPKNLVNNSAFRNE